MRDEWRDHVVLHIEDLAELLGMEGEPYRAWADQDGDYVHVVTKSNAKFKNGLRIARGASPEARTPLQDRY